MEESSTHKISLSKACFAHKKSSKKRKTTTSDQEDSSWLFHYKHTWAQFSQKAQEVEQKSHQETLDRVAKFVEVHRHRSNSNLPTACLVLGANQSDHGALVLALKDRLPTPHVALLDPRETPSIGALVYNMAAAFIKDDLQLTKRNCTFEKLCQWYCGQEVRGQPLVIILKDLEAFNLKILQSFILICRQYVERLPLLLVLCVATAASSAHHLLPHKVTSCLEIETFYFSPPSTILTSIIEQCVMSPSFPFKLGPQTFQLLIDIILFHDFSITFLLFIMQFCMFEHFYQNSLASLCCPAEQLEDALSPLQLEELFRLPSAKKIAEDLPSSKDARKKKACELLQALHKYNRDFLQHVTFLHLLCKDLPTNPLGKQLREVYALALQGQLLDSKEGAKAFTLLGFLSPSELATLVTALQDLLPQPLRAQVSAHLASCPDQDTWKTQANPTDLGPVTSRSQLKEKLKEMADSAAPCPGPWRTRLMELLRQGLRQGLDPPMLPLHEVLYWDDASCLRHHMMAAPRSAVHKALINPAHYLHCECCQLSDPGSTCPSLPPTSMCYKLHLEGGKMINLYDWLQSFLAIKVPDGPKRKSKKKDDNNLYAEFFQAVSELQFLGYIRPTKRKVDHVARLTF